MEEIAHLVATIGADIKELEKGIEQAEEHLKEFESVVSKTGKNVEKTFKDRVVSGLSAMNTGLKKVTDSVFSLRGAFIGLGLGYFGKEIAEAGIRLEVMQRSFKLIFGSAEAAQREIQFLTDTARKYGLTLTALEKSYKDLAGSTLRTGISLQEIKDIFLAVAEAGTALGLSGQRIEMSLYAITQMISKGKVQTEELRRQLGEHLPGAFDILASSMNLSSAQLNKLLDRGQVMAKDVLPALAKALHETFGKTAIEMSKTSIAEFRRLETEWEWLKREFATSGFLSALAEGAHNLSETFKDPDFKAGVVAIAEGISGIVSALADLVAYSGKLTKSGFFKFLSEHGDLLLSAYVGGKVGGPAGAVLSAGARAWYEVETKPFEGKASKVGLLYDELNKSEEELAKLTKSRMWVDHSERIAELEERIKYLKFALKGYYLTSIKASKSTKVMDSVLRDVYTSVVNADDAFGELNMVQKMLIDKYREMTKALSMSEEEQAIYNALKEAEVDAHSAVGEVIKDVIHQYYKLKKALEAQQKAGKVIERLRKEYEYLTKSELEAAQAKMLDAAGVDIHSKESDEIRKLVQQIYEKKKAIEKTKEAIAEEEKQWEKFTKDFGKLSEQAVEVWHNSLQDFFSDALRGELDSAEAYFQSFANSLSDMWASTLTDMILNWDEWQKKLFIAGSQGQAWLDKQGWLGLGSVGAQSALAATQGNYGAGVGAVLGAGIGFWMGGGPFTAALGASIGSTAGSLFDTILGGDKGPSYSEKLYAAIQDLTLQLKENTRALERQLEGMTKTASIMDDLYFTFKNEPLGSGFGSVFGELQKTANIPWGSGGNTKPVMEGIYDSLGISGIVDALEALRSGDFIKFAQLGYLGGELSDTLVQMVAQGLQISFEEAERVLTEQRVATQFLPKYDEWYAQQTPEKLYEITEKVFNSVLKKRMNNLMMISDAALEKVKNTIANIAVTANDTADSISSLINQYLPSGTEYEQKLAQVENAFSGLLQEAEDILALRDYIREYAYENLSPEAATNLEKSFQVLAKLPGKYAEVLDKINQEFIQARMDLLDSAKDYAAQFETDYNSPSKALARMLEGIKDQFDSFEEQIRETASSTADLTDELSQLSVLESTSIANAVRGFVDQTITPVQESLQDLIFNLSGGGSLAPAMSWQQVYGKYESLVAQAKTADIDNIQSIVQDLVSYVPDVLSFAKALGEENYATITQSIISDLSEVMTNTESIEDRMLSELETISVNTGLMVENLSGSNDLEAIGQAIADALTENGQSSIVIQVDSVDLARAVVNGILASGTDTQNALQAYLVGG